MNVDPIELRKFSEKAHNWWDPQGEFKPLHDLNPLRLNYIDLASGLKNKNVLDVGCGGGILAESMMIRGAYVTGIDLSPEALRVAELHGLESGVKVDYQNITAEDLARKQPNHYDVVTCMELLEHVPQPASIVQACADLTRLRGDVFFSTINRNFKAYLFAVLGAEYVLNLLPRGTHDYAKFIRPSELIRFCRQAGLEIVEIMGMTYNPLTKVFTLNHTDVDVNYILHCKKC